MSEHRRRILIAGAGGFAREVRWLLAEIDRLDERYDFLGYIVSNLSQLGEHDSRDAVLGDFDWLDCNVGAADALAIGVGNPSARARLGREVKERFPHLELPPLIHPSVRMDSVSCHVGDGAIVCANCVLTVNVQIDRFAMVNLSCTIGHETRVGEGCVLNPAVNLSGGVVLGNRVLVGTGAQVLQYVAVGDDAVIGAGAVVTKDVPAGQTVVGVPAKPVVRT